MNPYVIGIGLGLMMWVFYGCAAGSPDTYINIDKSITVTNPAEEFSLDYETNSGVGFDGEFDGEVSPDVTTDFDIKAK